MRWEVRGQAARGCRHRVPIDLRTGACQRTRVRTRTHEHGTDAESHAHINGRAHAKQPPVLFWRE